MDFKDYYEILGVAPDAEKYDELLAQYQQWQQTGGRPPTGFRLARLVSST